MTVFNFWQGMLGIKKLLLNLWIYWPQISHLTHETDYCIVFMSLVFSLINVVVYQIDTINKMKDRVKPINIRVNKLNLFEMSLAVKSFFFEGGVHFPIYI